MMARKFCFLLGILVILGFPSVLGFSNSMSGGYTNNWQYNQPSFNQIYSSGDVSNYWPILNNLENDQCEANTDFIIGIPPGGCSPTVVRSDLLAEQNVPVFCQLYAIRINPLIKASSIKSISFRGEYPSGVSGVSFHPARAAVKSYQTLLGDPTINNIGYVVIILSRERVEANMEEWIAGNLTANIRYDAVEAYGTGNAQYYLSTEENSDWNSNYQKNSFWNGRGFLRLESAGNGQARISVMTDKDRIYRTLTLNEGETSGIIYFPGYYCQAGLKVKLNDLVAPEDGALLKVDGNDLWVRQGSELLDGKCKVSRIEVNEDSEGSVDIRCLGQSFLLKLDKKNCSDENESCLVVDKEYNETVGTGGEINRYYSNLSEIVVNELVGQFPREVKGTGLNPYAEETLFEQILLAEKLEKYETAFNLTELFIETYPSSEIIDEVRRKKKKLGEFNLSSAYRRILVSNTYYDFSLEALKGENEGKAEVDLRIGSIDYPRNNKKDRINLSTNGLEYLIVSQILPSKIVVNYFNENSDAKIKRDTVTLTEGVYGSVGGREVFVRNIEVTEVAYVSLIPEVRNTQTEANFTFKIGIEKRAIELTPDRARKMINNLNDTINRWEEINDRLVNLVKGWKAACFATSTILMIKNMATGISGESMARQKVMERYKQICAINHSEMTRTQCYNHLSDKIDADVAAMANALNTVNDNVGGVTDKHKTADGLFGQGTIVNQTAYVEDLKSQIPEKWTTEIDGQKITREDLTTSSQVQAVLLYNQLSETSGVALETAEKEMGDSLRGVALVRKVAESRKKSEEQLNNQGISNAKVQSFVSESVKTLQWGGQTGGDIGASKPDGINEDDKIQFINYNGEETYLLKLNLDTGISQVGIDKAYLYDDGSSSWVGASVPSDMRIMISTATEGSCSNRWPEDTRKLSYYETGANKGLPAIVPFDVNEGWYAMVPNSGGTFLEDSPQGYTQSADVSYFHICNIGSNQLMESGRGDDLCQSFSTLTVGSVEDFIPCRSMSSAQVSNLYNRAREAIRQASQQSGQRDVTILGELMSMGAPMSDVGDFECQDFMSPDDCKLMFNVCDPVICPTSRCDLGGRMPVSNVIQTGIIGSLMLCLPNAREGILIPICVSGVQAGIDSYLSILKSHRECLQRSLETGEYVGICDQITSIYMCEFFWRQLSPVMDIMIPRFIEGLYGRSESVRGGAEYAMVQNSWNNLQSSIDYFQNTYATNAFRAFRMRSVSEAGGTFCRAFLGTSVPSSAEALDSLLEPESPPQFYASFSEILFTEATVPSTSQYKVYYHIYAGKERGSQYQVYLKSPPDTSYYRSNPYVVVKTGFIGVGESADESIDFTAPSGYKELCVVIDAQERCGFKQVTTDGGLNYVRDKYVQEQAETSDITSEKECISGSPSALSLVTPNIQAGFEDMATPEIAMSGIVRICASSNPQEGVEFNASRWKDVGYCGDSSIRCWLDTNSVKDNLRAVEAVEGSSISLLDESRGLMADGKLKLEDVAKTLSRVSTEINDLGNDDLKDESSAVKNIFGSLDNITGVTGEFGGSGTNADRAHAYALKASVYRRMIELRIPSLVEIKPAPREVVEAESDDESRVDGSEKVDETGANEGNDDEGGVMELGIDQYDRIVVDTIITSFFLNETLKGDYLVKSNFSAQNVYGYIDGGNIIIPNTWKNLDLIEGFKLEDLENYRFDEEKGEFVLKS